MFLLIHRPELVGSSPSFPLSTTKTPVRSRTSPKINQERRSIDSVNAGRIRRASMAKTIMWVSSCCRSYAASGRGIFDWMINTRSLGEGEQSGFFESVSFTWRNKRGHMIIFGNITREDYFQVSFLFCLHPLQPPFNSPCVDFHLYFRSKIRILC